MNDFLQECDQEKKRNYIYFSNKRERGKRFVAT